MPTETRNRGSSARVERFDVAIIGGGITGLALAWELAKRGNRKIAVVERRVTGSGASSRNIGRVRAMQLTAELARVAILAQRKHAGLSRELGANTLFWRAGYAWVLYDEAEIERIRDIQRMLRELGLAPRLLDRRATLDLLPILEGGEPPAGAFCNRDAIVHHDAVVYAYRAGCLRGGVVLRESTEVAEILVEGGRVAGVAHADGEIRAPIVVNAAGGWSSRVSALAGIEIPNTPLRREALVTESVRPFMTAAVSFYRPTEGWFHQTLRGELVAGAVSLDEVPGVDFASTCGALQRTTSLLLRKAPRLAALRVVRQWAGVYDLTPDRKPLIGPVDAPSGFVQANGYSGRGFALAPLLMEQLALWLDRGERPEILAPFDPNRFAGRPQLAVTVGDYYAGYAAQ